jgi:cation diffusion facilitator CzcD-associated flavoprotein CzcO
MNNKVIGIIGGGISGIFAAKQAKSYGYDYVIFEKSDSLFGVWRDDGHCWPTMTTNVCKYQ